MPGRDRGGREKQVVVSEIPPPPPPPRVVFPMFAVRDGSVVHLDWLTTVAIQLQKFLLENTFEIQLESIMCNRKADLKTDLRFLWNSSGLSSGNFIQLNCNPVSILRRGCRFD